MALVIARVVFYLGIIGFLAFWLAGAFFNISAYMHGKPGTTWWQVQFMMYDPSVLTDEGARYRKKAILCILMCISFVGLSGIAGMIEHPLAVVGDG